MSNRRMVSFAAALQSSQDDDDEEEIGSKEEEEDDDEDNDDDPRLSAAALCISFRFHPSIGASHPQTTSVFGPEYTHQCFEGEYIPGYQPYERDVLQRFLQLFATHQSSSSSTPTKTTTTSPSAATTTSTTNPVPPRHASHAHFETATHSLRIKIHVAPSCAVCQVQLETHPKPMTSSSSSSTDSHTTDPPLKKRPKLEQTDANGDETDDNTNNEQAPMPKPQILKCLEKMLPDMVQRDVRNDFLAQPFGTVLREYHRPTSNNNNKDADKKEESFCLCLAHGNQTPGVAAYHNSIQRLALGWIETADAIDITHAPQAGGQYWQILYLFQKHSTTRYSLAGYMTLWTVTSVLARPTPGVLLRITQALLLPHYQRQGHGQEMIRAVYQLAHDPPTVLLSSRRPATTVPKPPPSSSSSSISILLERKDNDYPIVQVNVEDPSPGFTALRNLVDYTMFVENSEWQDQLLWRTATTTNKNNDDNTDKPNKSRPLVPLDDPYLMELAHRSKLTPRQVQIVYELFYLRQLQQHQQLQVPATTERDDSSSETAATTRFRLQVKERLYKEHKAMIESLSSKEEMKNMLSQLYEEVVEAYHTILNKVHGTTPNETNNKNNDS